MTELILTFIIIVLCFAGLSIGVIFSGKKLSKGCGGFFSKGEGAEKECGVCGKKGDSIEACEENPSAEPAHPDDSVKPAKKPTKTS